MRTMGVACVAALLGLGCASAGPTGEGAALDVVEQGTLESSLHYLDFDLAPGPLTESELLELGGDLDSATPVGVRVHDGFAVAWHAPLGEPRIGHQPSALAAWRVTPIRGDLDPREGRGDVADPSDPGTVRTPGIYVPPGEVGEDLRERLDIGELRSNTPELQVDWIDEIIDEFIEYWLFHPECV